MANPTIMLLPVTHAIESDSSRRNLLKQTTGCYPQRNQRRPSANDSTPHAANTAR